MDTIANPFKSFKIKRTSIHEQIADSIEEMLAAGQLHEGQQLPSERDLAAALGVNRASVRQAVYLLQQRGLVKTRLGSGTYVTRMSRSVVGQSIERYFVFGSCSHADLLTLREILEPEAAAIAAQRATDDDLIGLLALVEEIETTYDAGDLDACAQADAGFHERLAAATNNELIVAVANGLQRVMRTWLKAQAEAGYGRLYEGTRGHRVIYEAVAAHNPNGPKRRCASTCPALRALLLEQHP